MSLCQTHLEGGISPLPSNSAQCLSFNVPDNPEMLLGLWVVGVVYFIIFVKPPLSPLAPWHLQLKLEFKGQIQAQSEQ